MLTDGNGDGARDAGDAVLAEAGAAERILWSAARRMHVDAGSELTHLHHDHLGNITLATDGGVIGQRRFYPTGAERPGAVGWVDDYGFTGQEHDGSGLVHFRFRHLDPATGRWTAADPLFTALSGALMRKHGEATTAYAYVGNDLASRRDPLGAGSKRGTAPP